MGAIELKKANVNVTCRQMRLNILPMSMNINSIPQLRVEYGRTRGVDVYMYTRSSSSTAKAMNAANLAVRARTAVDPVNAFILLLKLEVERYNNFPRTIAPYDGSLPPGRHPQPNAKHTLLLGQYQL
jgi:hypothetical protein